MLYCGPEYTQIEHLVSYMRLYDWILLEIMRINQVCLAVAAVGTAKGASSPKFTSASGMFSPNCLGFMNAFLSSFDHIGLV